MLSAIANTVIYGQISDRRTGADNDAGVVVNNYYNDYNFTSRINRFHRSYSGFDYYSPVFTDPYLYNRRPFSLGISFYGTCGFGIGYAYNFPWYDSGTNYYDIYDPYYGSSFYWGYDPFFYSRWYFPVLINLGFRDRWRNEYYGWNHNHAHNDYRSNNRVSNRYDKSSSSRYSSSGNSGRRRQTNISESPSGNVSRRYLAENSSRTNFENKGTSDRTNIGVQKNRIISYNNSNGNRRIEPQTQKQRSAPSYRSESKSYSSRSSSSRGKNSRHR